MTRRVIEPVCRGLRVVFTEHAIKVQLRTWLWWSTVYVMRPSAEVLGPLCSPLQAGTPARRYVARLAIDAYLSS
jgi:hypothetical protein